jgi:hypothetical protein
MTIKELAIAQIDALGDQQVHEVLDFIGYLKQKDDREEWTDLMNAQQGSLMSVWDNDDDDVWNGL